MAALEPSASTNSLAGYVPSLGGRPGGPADAESFALTESQRQILEMLEDKPHAPAAQDAKTTDAGGFGLDIAFAAVGATAILSGIVLVFFFAAAGSVLLVLGAVLCAVAFEHVALRDLTSEEANLVVPASADVGVPTDVA